MTLKDNRCEACSMDSLLSTTHEIEQLKLNVPKWQIINIDNINKLTREFKFNNYSLAVKFTNQVVEISELEGHHPAILLEWGKVTVTWWSHKIKGLHKNDFIMGAKTDAIKP